VRSRRSAREVKLPRDLDIFSPAHHDETVVDPVVGEGPADGHGLGPLVLVVGEGQIDTAAVDVEAVAQRDRAT
jgi:hypothetical protein